MLTTLALYQGGLQIKGGSGDCMLTPAPTVLATDANDTLTMDKLQGGVLQYTSFSAGRNLTTDTAANILAALPELDIGDSVMICISLVAAFAGTYVAGASVTLAGRATTPASSFSLILITRTGAATVTWRVL